MKIGMYGGSFDMPHIGHLLAATAALQTDIELLYVVPCFQQTGKQLKEFYHRLKMCELTFERLPRVIVSPIEEELGGESFTHRTLEALRQRHDAFNPYKVEGKVSLVCGSDTFEKIPSWVGGQRTLELANPLIVPRTPVSSTMVRNLLQGTPREVHIASGYLERDTFDYIRRYGLYGSS